MSEFYVTFGSKHRSLQHPTLPAAHPDGWVTIVAVDADQARSAAVKLLGREWSSIYSEASSFRPPVYMHGERSGYPLGELARFDAGEVLR